ncbi:hypothetical protein [Plantactinospora alkalitolerans]|uniref:hypothetical protein n=1 Tax=Plantactinospora alkalitolerans TaxID=2789879 RepID=UPI001E4B3220|nr:hypothetical protein [Plantactinospora alkalitolerans]
MSAVEVRPDFMDYHPQARLVDLATAKAAGGPRATAYNRIHRRIAEFVNARGAASDGLQIADRPVTPAVTATSTP